MECEVESSETRCSRPKYNKKYERYMTRWFGCHSPTMSSQCFRASTWPANQWKASPMEHKSPEENSDTEYLSVTDCGCHWMLGCQAVLNCKGSVIQHGVLVKYRNINWSKRNEEISALGRQWPNWWQATDCSEELWCKLYASCETKIRQKLLRDHTQDTGSNNSWAD